MSQAITPELRQWIVEQAQAGHSAEPAYAVQPGRLRQRVFDGRITHDRFPEAR